MSNSNNPYGIKPYTRLNEEDVRSYMFDELVETFGFDIRDMEKEFPIRMGSSTKRLDIAIFRKGTSHIQANIYLIVECKKSNDIYIDEARDQLFSYSAACLNAKYGIVASSKCEIWQKVPGYDEHTFEEIEFLPNAAGEKISFDYQPPR